MVPSLYIVNCTFQNFDGDFDSLINIEQGSLTKTTFEGVDFYLYNGRQSGGNITLDRVKVINSRFNRGMIFSRKLTNDIEYSMNLVNQTLIYDQVSQTFDNLKYQSILVLNSSFSNLNSYKSVTALAKIDTSTLFYIITNHVFQTIRLLRPIHHGIILNLEDYTGSIILSSNVFEKNMQFISEYNNTLTYDPERRKLQDFHRQFKDGSSEYKMGICQQNFSFYLFGHGFFNEEMDDIESYHDKLERISSIYISRFSGNVMISKNVFQNNIGTFGGAISINSPLWGQSENTPPFIHILNNTFTNNTAYLSGNAIHIRCYVSSSSYDSLCGSGIEISYNNFVLNGGTKISNGGALTVICKYLTGLLEFDILEKDSSVSPEQVVRWGNSSLTSQQIFGRDLRIKNSSSQLNLTILYLNDNLFQLNGAGQRGSAVFLSYINNVYSTRNFYYNNIAVYSQYEIVSSPFYNFLSQGIPFTFYWADYPDKTEYHFMLTKLYIQAYQDGYTRIEQKIQNSVVKGALSLLYPNDESLVRRTWSFQENQSYWVGNNVGFLMPGYQSAERASSVYIENGVNVLFNGAYFFKQVGSINKFVTDLVLPDRFRKIFYLAQEYSQSSLIVIKTHTEGISEKILATFEFQGCQFGNSTNMQFFDENDFIRDTNKVYHGQIIRLTSNFDNKHQPNYIPMLLFNNSQVKNQFFIGTDTSQFYVEQAILQILNSTFMNIGFYYQEWYQEKGLIIFKSNIISDPSFNLPNNSFSKNIVIFLYSKESCILTLRMSHQVLVVQDNIFFMLVSATQGVLISHGDILEPSFNNYILVQFNELYYSMGTLFLFPNYHFGKDYVDQSVVKVFNNMFKATESHQKAIMVSSTQMVAFAFDSNKVAILDNSGTLDLNLKTYCRLLLFNGYGDCRTKSLVELSLFNATFNQEGCQAVFYFFRPSNQLPSTNNGQQAPDNSKVSQAIQNELMNYTELMIDGKDSKRSFIFINNYVQMLKQKTSLIIAYGSDVIIDQNPNSTYITLNKGSDDLVWIVANMIFIMRCSCDGYIDIRQQSRLKMAGQLLQYGSAIERGSIINVDNSYVNLTYNFMIKLSLYDQSSFVKVSGDSNVTLSGLFFSYITAESSLFKIKGFKDSLPIYFEDIWILMGDVQNFFEFDKSEVIMSRLYLYHCKATQIFIISESKVTIDDTIMFNDPILVKSKQVYQFLSKGVILIRRDAEVVLSNSIFMDLLSNNYTFIYAFENAKSIQVINCTILRGYSFSPMGSVIRLQNVQNAVITKCQFIDLELTAISLLNSTLSIYDSQFLRGKKQQIYAVNSGLLVFDSVFDSLSDYFTSSKGGGIYCLCHTLRLENNVFRNLTALAGGAIFVNSLQINNTNLVIIMMNTFIENKAIRGGAIYVEDSNRIQIYSNEFIRNQAIDPLQGSLDTIGGALFLSCYYQGNSSLENCNFKIKSNRFLENQASGSGGAISWTSNADLLYKQNIFKDNQAIYGQNISSYPKFINVTLQAVNDWANPNQTSSVCTQESCEFIMVSGTPFDFKVKIYDQYGQLCTSDSYSFAIANYISQNNPSYALRNNRVTTLNGVLNFKDFISIQMPGSVVSIALKFYNLTNFNNKLDFDDFQIKLRARKCLRGEQYTQDGRCLQCEQGKFNYEDPVDVSFCSSCPAEAICFGGKGLAPNNGYQRSKVNFQQFFQCPIENTCLKGDLDNVNGSCATGYSGFACASCSEDYYMSSNNECKECLTLWSLAMNAFKIMLQISFYTSLLIIPVITNTASAIPLYSVNIKILLSHFQTLGTLSTINYQWPQAIQTLVDFIDSVLYASDHVNGIECFERQIVKESSMPGFFIRIIAITIIPFISLLLATVMLALHTFSLKLKRKNTQPIKNLLKIFQAIIFLTLTDNIRCMFRAFSYTTIDSQERFTYDLDYVFLGEKHTYYLLYVIAPLICLWLILVPTLFTIVMLRYQRINRLRNDNDFSKADLKVIMAQYWIKWGFLLNGYSPEYFYWELIITLRKSLMITFAGLLVNTSPQAQILIASQILILNILLQIRLNPYYRIALNRLEIVSLYTIGITFYISLQYISNDTYLINQNPSLGIVMQIAMISPSIFFLAYWLKQMRIEVLKELLKKGYYKLIKLLYCKSFDKIEFYLVYLSNDPEYNLCYEENDKIEIRFTPIEQHCNFKDTKEKSSAKLMRKNHQKNITMLSQLWMSHSQLRNPLSSTMRNLFLRPDQAGFQSQNYLKITGLLKNLSRLKQNSSIMNLKERIPEFSNDLPDDSVIKGQITKNIRTVVKRRKRNVYQKSTIFEDDNFEKQARFGDL